ncbi:MAG: DUF362 domain-containing protein [bacterium]
MPRVSLVKVENEKVHDAVKRAIDLIGGIGKYVKRKDRVVIKVNMFIKDTLESGKITDPRVVLAVAKLAKDRGAKITVVERTHNIYADFEAFPEIERYAKVVSLDDVPHIHKHIPGARSLKLEVPIPNIIEECDVFINIPGLRTHALTKISNAMKNLMGILPGETPKYVHICGLEDSIVDLNAFRRSDLVVVDAIYSLQGNFPGEGDPLKTDIVMAGDNAVAVDSVASRIVGFDPTEVYTISEGRARGLGPIDLDNIELLGESLPEISRGINFEKPALNYDGFRGRFEIVDSGICDACRRALACGLTAASHHPKYSEVGDVTIAVGPPEGRYNFKNEKVILYGNCARRTFVATNKHLWVPGCPPLAGQAKEALLTYGTST